jgi:hypothetical protein
MTMKKRGAAKAKATKATRNKAVVEGAIEFSEDGPDDVNVYVVVDGRRVARRGKPDTPHEGQWISLEPGFVVRNVGNWDGIVVEFCDVSVN